MDVKFPNTVTEAWKLNEVGLSIFPLGSSFEEPPAWFVEGRCSGDAVKAKEDWPKAPRFRWKQYQEQAAEDSEIEKWADQWPYTNWAIVTGYRVVVVDADSQEAVTFIEGGAITRTPLRATTSKGKHFYFMVNPDYPIHNSVRKNKIDLRGIGGYVVAPGSTHADGTLYQWETDGYMEISDLKDLPMLTPDDIATINGFNGDAAENAPVGNLGFSTDQYPLAHNGSNLAEGQGRNNAAASMAGQLIQQGHSLVEIKAVLDQWNQSNTPPLSPGELNSTIASIARTHTNNNPGATISIEPPPKPEFEFCHVEELVNGVKPINWLIKGFLEMDSLSLMFGEPACGKSFTAIDLACCVATGNDWHGKPVKKPGSVFYIAGEGFNGLSRRLMAWQQSNGYNLRNAPLYISKCSAALTNLGSARAVSESIDQIVQETNAEIPSLIVIDTLARNFGPGDENATQEMNVFITHIDQLLRVKYECCVMIVHHTGVGSKDRARGNSALKAALDAEYAVVKSDDEVKIITKKMKDADEPEDMHFMFNPVQLPFLDDDGEPQYSCSLRLIDKNAEMLARREEGVQIAIDAGRKQSEINIGEKQIEVIRNLNALIMNAKSVLAKSGRDPSLARIEVKGLREIVTGKNIVPRKNWGRTFNALVERGFLEVNEPFVTITEKGRNIVFGGGD